MPLRDHFRSPVNDKHTWDELHGGWPAMIVRDLFDVLPAGYQASLNIHLGSPFEVHVATYKDETRDRRVQCGSAVDAVATQPGPTPTLTLEADLSEQDEYEVRIYDAERGRRLVAAIEIVSPSNKDRPDSRETFVAKVAALLQKEVCVSVVDLVTVRQFNLYADLLELLGQDDPQLAPTPPNIYAVSLRARKRPSKPSLLDVWFYPMNIGQSLPILPIWLTPDLRVLLLLETSYAETCRLLHIA